MVQVRYPWRLVASPIRTGLDYRRFMSDIYVRFQQEQVDILRRICPTHLITHN